MNGQLLEPFRIANRVGRNVPILLLGLVDSLVRVFVALSLKSRYSDSDTSFFNYKSYMLAEFSMQTNAALV